MTIESIEPEIKPAYARVMRRIQGVLIDSIVILVIMAGALIIAVSLQSDHVARILGFAFAATLLLYEPLLVSGTGGTLGHHACNIRVIDDRHHGNVGFGKAFVRMIIKSILGWYSFISMALTSRHQAVHDLLTGSTVQIKDLAKANPYHFTGPRETTPTSGMPTRVRRAIVIAAYGIGWSALSLFALSTLPSTGVISWQCVDNGSCLVSENLLLVVLELIWFGGIAFIVILGWRGRLWGGRTRRLVL